MSNETLKIIKSEYHRNGVSGVPFQIVIFDYKDNEVELKNMCAFLFEESCAITNIDQLAAHNIEFGNGNSWRSEKFETLIRQELLKTFENDLNS
jgi:hypothetical protein